MAKSTTAKKSSKGSAFEWPLVKRILSYTRPYRGWFILSLLSTIFLSLVAPIIPYLFQYVLDDPTTKGDVAGVRNLVLAIFGVLVLRALLMYGNTLLTGWLGQTIIHDLRQQVYTHITSLRAKYFDQHPVGQLQTRTISDVETLNNVFSQGLVTILGEILQLLVIFSVMMYTNVALTLVVLSTIPILLFGTYIFKNAIRSAFQKVRKYVSEMNSFLQEHITGMMVTQIFGREKVELDRFDDINKKHLDANLKSVMAYSIFFPVVEIITALATALLVWYGVGSVLSGAITFGTLVAFLMYISMFFRPIRMLADRFNTLQLGMVSAERIFQVLDTEEKIENDGELLELPALPGYPPEEIEIDFKKVWFAYNDHDWVLQDVSFKVDPGQTVAIVGSTGAGKSTIINLLTRFYEINRGKISLNGVDISELELPALRKNIGLVLQDVFLFSGSIFDNISLNNPDVTLEQAQQAAKIVGADKFIQNLPGKYDYNVQERGATLSAGQRQLIAFARVLVYDPRILILDEATSNVDTESEEMIQTAIDKVMHGRTAIIVAHRLSTIQKADLILVMEKGKVIESGNHQQLLEVGGIYRKLYDLQFA